MPFDAMGYPQFEGQPAGNPYNRSLQGCLDKIAELETENDRLKKSESVSWHKFKAKDAEIDELKRENQQLKQLVKDFSEELTFAAGRQLNAAEWFHRCDLQSRAGAMKHDPLLKRARKASKDE